MSKADIIFRDIIDIWRTVHPKARRCGPDGKTDTSPHHKETGIVNRYDLSRNFDTDTEVYQS